MEILKTVKWLAKLVWCGFVLIFFAPYKSFTIWYLPHHTRGYLQSYSRHVRFSRWIKLFSIVHASTMAVIIFSIIGILRNASPALAATCNISGPTTIDQSYVDTNSCADIHITGTTTVVVSSINLNGSSAGVFYIDSSVTATFDGALTLSDSADSLVVNGTLRPVSGNTTGLTVTAQTMTINSSGTINANNRGCAGGTSSGDGLGPDTTTGTCTISTSGYGDGSSTGGAGGSHGGAGGRAADSFTGTTYDSSTAPTLFGSGGGAGGTNIGGAGGGKVRLDVAGTLTISGTITANGANGLAGGGNAGGGGSGGSVYITCGTLAGTSTISTTGGNGGDGSSNDGGGGGGGRVSIYYITLGSFTLSNATATKGSKGGAGQNNGADGADGTVNTVQYTVPATPSITAPAASATNQLRTLIPTSSAYSANGLTHTTSDWQISDDNTFSDSDCSDTNIVWCALASSQKTSTTVNTTNGTFQNALSGKTLLAPNVTYYIRVRHTNAAGNSNWSSSVAFTTAANVVPATPTNSAPANAATSVSKNPTLTSSTFSDSDGDAQLSSSWRIRESSDCSGTNVWSKTDDTTNLTSIVVNTTNGTFADSLSGQTSLKSHTTYSFQVLYKDTYSGSSGLSACTSFTTLNTTPTLASNVPNQTLYEDTNVSTAFNLNTYITDVDFNDNGSLVCSATDGFSASLGTMTINSNGAIDFTPAANANGSDTIQFSCQDGAAAAATSNVITVTLTAVNDVPSFTKGSNQTVLEDAGAQTVTTWATSISSGPSNESTQTLTFTATNTNNSLFSTQPSVSTSTGNLTYTPATNANGSATVTISLSDDGGTTNGGNNTSASQTFTISVTAVNDTPVFSSSISVSAWNEDTTSSNAFDLDTYFSDADTGDVCTFSVVTNPSPQVVASIASDNQVSFTPAASYNGSTSVKFRCTDGSSATVDSNTITLTVTSVNDVPTVTTSGGQTVSEDVGSTSVTATGSDADGDAMTYVWTESSDSGDGCSLSSFSAASPTVTILNRNSSYSCVFSVYVKDSTSSSATAQITINVTGDNDTPVLTTVSEKTVDENESLTFSVGASDQDSSSISLSAADTRGDFSAQGVTVSSLFKDNSNNTGTFSWTPGFTDSGSYQLTVNGTDAVNTASEIINVTVREITDPPTFSGSLPNVSFVAGRTTSTIFDLNDYFTDDSQATLSFTSTGTKSVEVTIKDGQVSLSAPSSFVGHESLTFVAHDAYGLTVDSNTIILTVSAPTIIDIGEIDHINGSNSGPGIITIIGDHGETLGSIEAFPIGGVIPKIASLKDANYIFAVKRRSGSTIHVYNLIPKLVMKHRLSPHLHYRQIATGNLDNNLETEEVAVATRRDSTAYIKIFSFRPLVKQATLRVEGIAHGIYNNHFTLLIKQRKLFIRNKSGDTIFTWRPFPANTSTLASKHT